MSRLARIETELTKRFALDHLEVIDESSGHNVPVGSESHFKVVLVSDEFGELKRIDRHRAVNAVLASEFDGGMHALAVHTYTQDEWRKRFGEAPLSPPCHGGEG